MGGAKGWGVHIGKVRDEGPFLQRPMPRHDVPNHAGWYQWCRLCQQLKSFVDQCTGKVTAWEKDESRPAKRSYGVKALVIVLLLSLTGCACNAIPGHEHLKGVFPICWGDK